MLYRTLPSLSEVALIDPSTCQVEVFTLESTSGAWWFTDPSRADALTLASIALEMPLAAVCRGLEPA